MGRYDHNNQGERASNLKHAINTLSEIAERDAMRQGITKELSRTNYVRNYICKRLAQFYTLEEMVDLMYFFVRMDTIREEVHDDC